MDQPGTEKEAGCSDATWDQNIDLEGLRLGKAEERNGAAPEPVGSGDTGRHVWVDSDKGQRGISIEK